MNKTIIFDMDGTIADLYGVPNWLAELRAEKTTPYEIAEPMYNMALLNGLLLGLKQIGFTIVVTSWTSKESTEDYKKAVSRAKKEWLDRYKFPYDSLHFVQYGTPKAYPTKKLGGLQILVDDNKEVREKFEQYKTAIDNRTIDATQDIITEIMKIFTEKA